MDKSLNSSEDLETDNCDNNDSVLNQTSKASTSNNNFSGFTSRKPASFVKEYDSAVQSLGDLTITLGSSQANINLDLTVENLRALNTLRYRNPTQSIINSSTSSSTQESSESPYSSISNSEMGYGATYTSYLAVQRGAGWYDVEKLQDLMHAIWKINFSIVEQRAQALTALNNMSVVAPFARDKRFPDDKYYITLGTGDWIRKFQQLRTSLSFKENQKEKKTSASTSSNVELQDANDSILAFHNSISSILLQLSQFENVFDRDTFERRFSLTWTD